MLHGTITHFVSGFSVAFSHAKTITENFEYLTRNLDATNGLLCRLHQDGVLELDEMQSVSGEQNRGYVQNEKLLFILVRKTEEQFNTFLDALDTTRQSYIREHISSNQQSRR